MSPKKILWLTWKDRSHPFAGGAELVNEHLAERLVRDGHEVIFVVAGFKGCAGEDSRSGFKIIRLGEDRYTVYLRAWRYYRRKLQGWADLVIDEMNIVPFMAKFYAREKNILFVHNLGRRIWFYQMPFPFSAIGYLVEPIYLRLLNDRKVVTISESTKKDLMRYGFKRENISIISEGIEIKPLEDIAAVKKFEEPTLLSLGEIRGMKRTGHIIRAFEIAKEKMPALRLIVAGGSGPKGYGAEVVKMMQTSKYADSIQYLNKVTEQKKVELMAKAHLLAVTSVKEGWGLVVTEAASQGTPAVVYDVDGLRDAVMDERTGLVTDRNTPADLAEKIVELLRNEELYASMRQNAWEWSKEINFDNCYRKFLEVIEKT